MARNDGWWLSSTEHVVAEDVPAAPRDVREFYGDLHNITRFHPLVVSVQAIGDVRTDHSHTQTYRIRDRIPLGPFTVPISYTARVTVPTAGDVLTEARQFPRVRLYGRVSFDQIDGGTRLTERLRIDAPRLLAPVTAQQAVKAHAEMLAGIRRCFQ